MPYNLRQMIRRAGVTRRKALTLRAIVPTQSHALELAQILVEVPRAWLERRGALLAAYERVSARDAGMVADGIDEAQAAIDEAEGEIYRLILALTPRLADWTIRVEKWHRRKFIAAVLSPTGVNLDTLLGPDGTTMEEFRRGILALIRNIDDDTSNRIAGEIWRGFQERRPAREVAKGIAQATEIGRKRALRIASDQTVKMAARLDQARQEEAGITEYRWRKSGKLRPRPVHVARDGQIFQWAKPPQGGHPGTEPNCGCKAEGHLDLD